MLGACLMTNVYAQPQKRRAAVTEQKQVTDRASLQFPAATDMPDDMVWKRDVYRQLDLTVDKNAPSAQVTYSTVEPTRNNVIATMTVSEDIDEAKLIDLG